MPQQFHAFLLPLLQLLQELDQKQQLRLLLRRLPRLGWLRRDGNHSRTAVGCRDHLRPPHPSPSGSRTQLAGRIVLHFLPPYCPQENRIERLWKDVHDNVTRNHDKKTMTDLLEAIFRYLSSRLKTRREPLGSY